MPQTPAEGDAALVPNKTEIDGVTTFWLPAEGPVTAALLFRVGRSDEPLAWSGVTHLVEHLALHSAAGPREGVGGFVDHWHTALYMTGKPEDVSEFLTRLTKAISDLPFERLEDERRILTTESAGRKTGPLEAVWSVRYGASGPGTTAYPELGLRWLGANEVSEWAARYFTRQNAVLWIAGSPPTGLTLTLPDGERHPDIPAIPVEQPLPTWFHGLQGGVSLSMVGPRNGAFLAAAAIFERRTRQRLRFDQAVSYSVYGSYLPIGRDVAHCAIVADALPENAWAARDGVLATLDALGESGADRFELDALEPERQDPKSTAGAILDSAASAHLIDRAFKNEAELKQDRESLTSDEVAAAAREAFKTAIMMLPRPCPMPDQRFHPVPDASRERTQGLRYQPVNPSKTKLELIVGEEAASFIQGNNVYTVPFDECVALQRWDDGQLFLRGRDGFGFSVVPRGWKKGAELARILELSVPATLHVPMGAPAKPPPVSAQARSRRRSRTVTLTLLSIIGPIFLAVGFFGQPDVADKVPPSAKVALTANGHVDCGGPSVALVLRIAHAPSGHRDSEVAQSACVDGATSQFIGSGVIGFGASAVAFVGWRRRYRAKRARGA